MSVFKELREKLFPVKSEWFLVILKVKGKGFGATGKTLQEAYERAEKKVTTVSEIDRCVFFKHITFLPAE
jgi:hypothetical protein